MVWRATTTTTLICKGDMMKRKGTPMGSRAATTVICALFLLVPVDTWAQAGGNPWNPYRAPQAQSAPPPAVSPSRQFQRANPPQPTQPMAQPQAPSRFAPPGLEQHLATGTRFRAPAPATTSQPTGPGRASPPYYVPPAQGYGGGFGYAPRAFGPYGAGYAAQGGYPQAYGGYPQGYSGYAPSGPFAPYGFPTGPGNFGPFPGNQTNGGIPGFNISPFGFF